MAVRVDGDVEVGILALSLRSAAGRSAPRPFRQSEVCHGARAFGRTRNVSIKSLVDVRCGNFEIASSSPHLVVTVFDVFAVHVEKKLGSVRINWKDLRDLSGCMQELRW